MQVKIFRSYDERALEADMNDFLADYFTNQILKIDYKAILDHYDDLNERTHFLFTAIVHYIDHEESVLEGNNNNGTVAAAIFKDASGDKDPL